MLPWAQPTSTDVLGARRETFAPVSPNQRTKIIFIYSGTPTNQALQAGMSDMLPAEEKRSFPDHLYVDVPALVKKASLIVLLLCLFSMALTGLSGFKAIHPFVAILLIGACVLFYVMGEMLRRSFIAK